MHWPTVLGENSAKFQDTQTMSVAFEVHSMTSNACKAVVLLNKIRLIKIIDIYLMGFKR